MNTKDPVPRHPLLGFHHGAGTRYFIDVKSGTVSDDLKSQMVAYASMFLGVFSAVHNHSREAYIEFFGNAANDFNAKNRA